MKKTIFLFTLCCASVIHAQNVAINSTGAAPATSAMLDISSTTSGLLIPRMSSAQRSAIAAPATGLIVFDTSLGIFYYFDGTAWLPLLSSASGWMLAGNSLGGTEFMGSTNAQPVKFYSNNLERMRILSAGQVAINSTTTFGVSTFFSQATGNNDAIDGNASGTGSAVYGQNTAAGGDGVEGLSTSATGFGMWGINTNASGTGIAGTGNNQAANYLVAGSGGAFTGNTIGLYGYAVTGNGSSSFYGYNNAIARGTYVSYWSGTTYYKTIATGAASNSCSVPDLNGNMVVMHAPESPEALFEDYGQGQLVNGRAHITIDPIFSKNVRINEKHPLRVFIQLEGNCNGVYVSNKSETGFDVIELNNGTSNTPFQWHIVCNMKDAIAPNGKLAKFEDLRFEPAPKELENTSIPARVPKETISSETRK
jgi:hypothetical protein